MNKVIVLRILIGLALSAVIASLVVTAFFMGKLTGALNPAWTAEKAMCVSRITDIRGTPTGYVIGKVPAGEMVWFLKLDLPFAHIAYYDGTTWLEGAIPAFVLDVCGQ